MRTIKFNFKFLYNESIKIGVNIGSIGELKKELLRWPKSKQGCCIDKLVENKIDVYISEEAQIESTLMHELVHASDIICEKYLEIDTDDIKTKSQVFRYFVEKSEKLLEPLELAEGFVKNTDILSVFLLGVPLRIEITSNMENSNSICFRKNKWVYYKPTKEDGIVIKSISSRSCLAEVLSYFVFDMFSRKHIDDTETRAYSIGSLWESIIHKEEE